MVWKKLEIMKVLCGQGHVAAPDPSASVHLCRYGNDTCPGEEDMLGSHRLFPVYFEAGLL